MSAQPAPVSPEARIPTLDILRGFALFGVLWSNLNHYDPTPEATGLDHGLFWIQANLIQNRFYSLLGFLFGIGFAVQLGRAEARGGGIGRLFYRRMLVLLLIGAFHGIFIWSGDILTKFALVGCLLPLYRRFSPRGLLIAAVVTLFGVAYAALLLWAATLSGPPPQLPDFSAVYAQGSYLEVMPARLTEYLETTRSVVFRFWTVSAPFLTLFVLGLWAARTGILSNLRERRGWVRKAFWVSLGCVAVGLLAQSGFDKLWPRPALLNGPPGFDPPHLLAAWWLIARRVPILLVEWGTAGVYAAGITLLAFRPLGEKLLKPLAAVGRMSLTTYLVQSVISTLLFYGYGLGWYGTVSYTGMMWLTVAIFGLQLVWSNWWFRGHRFGPVEWLWRSLAYGKAQPMRVGAP